MDVLTYILALKKSKAYTDAIVSALSSGMHYIGAVTYYSNLPSTGMLVGDVYTVKYTGSSGTNPDGTEYVWGNYEGTEQWISLGPDMATVLSMINDKADKLAEVMVSTSGDVTQVLNAETIYHFTSNALTALTITLAATSSKIAQYHFDFISGETAATLTLPDTVKIDLDGTAGTGVVTYTMDPNTRYEIDILNGYGVISEWTI